MGNKTFTTVSIKVSNKAANTFADNIVETILSEYSEDVLSLANLDEREFRQAIISSQSFLDTLVEFIEEFGLAEGMAYVDHIDAVEIFLRKCPEAKKVVKWLDEMDDILFRTNYMTEQDKMVDLLKDLGYTVTKDY